MSSKREGGGGGGGGRLGATRGQQRTATGQAQRRGAYYYLRRTACLGQQTQFWTREKSMAFHAPSAPFLCFFTDATRTHGITIARTTPPTAAQTAAVAALVQRTVGREFYLTGDARSGVAFRFDVAPSGVICELRAGLATIFGRGAQLSDPDTELTLHAKSGLTRASAWGGGGARNAFVAGVLARGGHVWRFVVSNETLRYVVPAQPQIHPSFIEWGARGYTK